MSSASRRGRPVWLLLPVVSLALAIWACGSTPAISHQGAAHLRLAITFTAQYTGNTDTALVDVRIYDTTNNQLVFAPTNAHLTCEGADVKPDYQRFMRECPRQPAGGAYHFVYTDERGVVTTVVIPVPRGTVALLAPRPDDRVAIPANNALAIRYRVPTAGPDGSVTMDEVRALALCGETAAPPCGEVTFGKPFTTGEAVIGGDGVFQLRGDFSSFQPKPGMVDMTISVHVSPSQSGFARVDATFTDSVAAPITWKR